MDLPTLPTVNAADEDSLETEPWLKGLDGPVDVPRVNSLLELWELLQPPLETGLLPEPSDETAFWRWAIESYVSELVGFSIGDWSIALSRLRGEVWRLKAESANQDEAELKVTSEFNCFLNRVFQHERAAMVTRRAKPTKQSRPDAPRQDSLPASEPVDSEMESTDSKNEAVDSHFANLKKTGKSRVKDSHGLKPMLPKEDAPPSSLLAGVEIVDEVDVAFGLIARSKHNPRQSFDATLIAEMAPNIETICQLNPLLIRTISTGGKHELIDGETRHRAAEVAGVKALRCKIVKCTDTQAALMRLQTSMQRRDLNPIERAQAMADLLEHHGCTQRQLSDIVKLKQGSIDNLTRLLKLPQAWKDRVISGEITAAAARDLVPWVDEPGVLAHLEKELDKRPVEERSISLREELDEAIDHESRPMKENYYSEPPEWKSWGNVDLTNVPAETREQLRIRSIKHKHSQGSSDRAFNIELWRTLANAAKQRREAAEEKRLSKTKSSKCGELISPKQAAENAKKQAEIFNKKLYRYRTAWYQRQIVDVVKDKAIEIDDEQRLLLFLAMRAENASSRSVAFARKYRNRKDHYEEDRDLKNLERILFLEVKELEAVTGAMLEEFLSSSFEGFHSSFDPDMIEAIAKFLKIDLKIWPDTCLAHKQGEYDPLVDYLQLLNNAQLDELNKEWKQRDMLKGATRSFNIDAMAKQCRGKPTPKALIAAKPCPLR